MCEWDNEKNQANIEKHHISFEEIQSVFLDPHALEVYDILHSTNFEDRYTVIGSVENFMIVTVVCTDRKGITRIISARKATAYERKMYHENYTRKA